VVETKGAHRCGGGAIPPPAFSDNVCILQYIFKNIFKCFIAFLLKLK